jgi:hypothetical protein
MWFRFFTTEWHPFEDVVTFFLSCVWLVPFAFFISLTSAENSLPSYGATMSACTCIHFIINEILITYRYIFSAGEPVEADGSGKRSSNLLVACFKFLKRKQEELVPLERIFGDRHSGYKAL